MCETKSVEIDREIRLLGLMRIGGAEETVVLDRYEDSWKIGYFKKVESKF